MAPFSNYLGTTNPQLERQVFKVGSCDLTSATGTNHIAFKAIGIRDILADVDGTKSILLPEDYSECKVLADGIMTHWIEKYPRISEVEPPGGD